MGLRILGRQPLKLLRIEAWKSQDFKGVLNPSPPDTGAMLKPTELWSHWREGTEGAGDGTTHDNQSSRLGRSQAHLQKIEF